MCGAGLHRNATTAPPGGECQMSFLFVDSSDVEQIALQLSLEGERTHLQSP